MFNGAPLVSLSYLMLHVLIAADTGFLCDVVMVEFDLSFDCSSRFAIRWKELRRLRDVVVFVELLLSSISCDEVDALVTGRMQPRINSLF